MKILKHIILYSLLTITFLKMLSADTYTIRCDKFLPDWTIVLEGKTKAQPLHTAYGQILFTEGRMVYALSEDGKILWQKRLHDTADGYAAITTDNFVYFVTDKNRVSCLNQSGVILWQQICPYTIIQNPIIGEDGRIFVTGEKNISCYGMKGIRKWILEIPGQKAIPAETLNDGSLLVFPDDSKLQRTSALRISPFGTIIENIRFTGRAVAATSCQEGVLILFENKICGLYAVSSEGKSYTRWSIGMEHENISISPDFTPIILSVPKNKAAILFPSDSVTNVVILNTGTGEILNRFKLPDISGPVMYTEVNKETFIVSSKSTAAMYGITGNEIWKAVLPSDTNNLNYISFSPNGYLSLYNKTWDINAYRMQQVISIENFCPVEKINTSPYPFYIRINSTDDSLIDLAAGFPSGITQKQRITELKKGDYADKEILWTNETVKYSNLYIESLIQNNSSDQNNNFVFHDNIGACSNLITQMSLFGTNRSASFFAESLKTETNDSLLDQLVYAAGQYGYDPDGQILESVDYVLHKLEYKKNTVLLKDAADSIYKICRFMGNPAFIKKGKELLAYLLYPQFSSETRDYASTILQKIVQNDIRKKF